MIYGAIVKKRIREAFDDVNNRRWDKLMTSITPTVHHRFGGVHAIGGERHDREALRRWFERLARVLPSLELEIKDIWVKGPPWRTMVFVQWDGTATLLDGGPYFQHAIHVITLRWGKIAKLDVFEDSQEVTRALAIQAQEGLEEAVAEPILELAAVISHTAHATLDAPSGEVDLGAWLFGLSDLDYQACAKGHQGAGVFADEQGRGMVNVESIGGNLIVQHYRAVRANPSNVEMHSPASRVYLFHLVPVAAAVRWTLAVTPTAPTASDLACTVDVDLPPLLGVLARLSLLGHFLGRHVDEEARGFAADISRKLSTPL